jgi:hypothetical protein
MVLRIEQAEPEPPSRYFHASLYKFNGDAAAAVKLQLHKFIPNGSVNCDYDPHLDVRDPSLQSIMLALNHHSNSKSPARWRQAEMLTKCLGES